MFGFFGKKKSSQERVDVAIDPNIHALLNEDPLAGLDTHDVDVPHTDDSIDSNDPALIEELQKLGLESTGSPKKSRPKVPTPSHVPNIKVDDIHSLLQGEVSEEEVTLNEEDWNDPELLGALSQITGVPNNSSVSTEHHEVPTHVEVDREMEEILSPEVQSNIEESDFSEEIVPQQNPSNATIVIPIIENRILDYKRAAVSWKRNGQLDKARENLAIVKQLEALLNRAHTNQTIDETLIPAAPEIPNLEIQPSLKPSAKPEPPKKIDTTTDSSRLERSSSKISTVSNASTSSRSAKTPTYTPQRTSLSGKTTKTPSSSSFKIESLSELQETIQGQLKKATAIAALYLKQEQKAEALAYHKLRKQMVENLEIIDAWIGAGNSHVPPLSWTPVSYIIQNSQDDVAATEVELKITRGIDLQHRDVVIRDYDTWVKWEWEWPEPGHKLSKGESPFASKSNSPLKIPIIRGKPFQRFVERKKLLVEVCVARGVLRRPTPIGYCKLELRDLMTKCEVSGAYDLMEPGTKRAVGGKLELSLRIKYPLQGSDKRNVSENWVFLGPSENTTESKPTSHTSLQEEPKSKIEQTPIISTPAVKKSVSNSAVDSKAVEDDELSQAIIEFDNVEHIVSNVVLEKELEAVNTLIATKPTETLQDRHQALTIKMNLLVIQVQSGQLDMKSYIMQVKSAIARTKQLALIMKKYNELNYARKALARLKQMQQEVDEVVQAMPELAS